MNFWDRLDEVAKRWNVLRHPFYVRWSEGTLTREELIEELAHLGVGPHSRPTEG